MATRRWCNILTSLNRRATTALLSPTPHAITTKPIIEPITPTLSSLIHRALLLPAHSPIPHTRHFSSTAHENNIEEDDQNDAVEAEAEAEAEAIGYKVVGPLEDTERVFKPFESVFAVVQVGSHQFKVCNGDTIYVERLKYCDVNEKLILNKVLLLGSSAQTIIGRPILPDAAVHAVVEEHALDEKVIIFKKKRRKNYRRTRGHRQELTRLRITDIQGIARPVTVKKPSKAASKKTEKVAVAA